MSFIIEPGRDFDTEVDRIASAEIEAAAHMLETGFRRRDRGVHQARKRIKRIRGLLRLVRPADEAFFERENERFRDVGRALSNGRDATAMIETLDRLTSAATGPLEEIRSRLVARRDHLLHYDQDQRLAIDTAIVELRESLASLSARRKTGSPADAAAIIEAGVDHSWSNARRSLKQAREAGLADHFHDLRKAAKYHLFHMSLLQPFWPRPFKPRRDRTNKLGDILGELNDIDVVQAWLADEEGLEDEAARLGAAMRKADKSLRKQSLSLATSLFADRPEEVSERVAKAFRAAQRRRRPKHEKTASAA